MWTGYFFQCCALSCVKEVVTTTKTTTAIESKWKTFSLGCFLIESQVTRVHKNEIQSIVNVYQFYYGLNCQLGRFTFHVVRISIPWCISVFLVVESLQTKDVKIDSNIKYLFDYWQPNGNLHVATTPEWHKSLCRKKESLFLIKIIWKGDKFSSTLQSVVFYSMVES